MYKLEEVQWIGLENCRTFCIRDFYRYSWRVKINRWDIEEFIEEVVEKCSKIFSMSYHDFSVVFYDKNPDLRENIYKLFKAKTGIAKLKFRVNAHDEDVVVLLKSIIVPDMNYLEDTYNLLITLSASDKIGFWRMAHSNDLELEEATCDLRKVCNMYNAFDEKEKKVIVNNFVYYLIERQ